MSRLAVISNGFGEDAIAAGILRHLISLRPDLEITALPLVGRGASLTGLAQIVGPQLDLPAGGFTLHSPALLLRDIRAGLPRAIADQFRTARQLETDAVLVVGDYWAQVFAQLVKVPARRRWVVQPLVSIHQAGGVKGPAALLRERIFPPEFELLRGAAMVYTRDPATAEYLRQRGLERVKGTGNLYLEEAVPPVFDGSRRVLLLPGSRDYRQESLGIMLEFAASRPDLEFVVVWAGETPPEVAGFRVEGNELVRGETRVAWQPRNLEAILPGASAVIGTTGTANEQAAAAGVPVISFTLMPGFGKGFLDGQKRLLGRALTVTTRIADDLDEAVEAALLTDRQELFREMQERLGASGGSRRIAEELAEGL